MKYGSLFTGGGLADIGARLAGLTPVWGIELDSSIAAVAQQNDPTGTIHTASVLDVDYAILPRVDVLHASPPCPNFSVAKTGGAETDLDIALADAVCRAIKAHQPQLFTLENVRAYADSKSLARIQATLLDLDYHVTTVIVNAADYGVPQTRVRLFLIAHAGGWMQIQRPLPAKQPWCGWYQAIEDLIPSLPASQFAPWQLARLGQLAGTHLIVDQLNGSRSPTVRGPDDPLWTLPVHSTKHPEPRAFIVSNSKTEYSDGMRDESDPMLAVTPQHNGRLRAFIADQLNAGHKQSIRYEDQPIWTLPVHSSKHPEPRAWLIDGDNASTDTGLPTMRGPEDPAMTLRGARATIHRAWLDQGRVVAMTPRALARFQGVPNSYILPENKKALACKIIGNGVPPEEYEAIVRSQL